MKTTFKITTSFIGLILIPITLCSCLTSTSEFKSFSEAIPDESYIVMHQDAEDNFQSFFPSNTEPHGIRETNHIFTDYEKAREMALKHPKSYIFKLYSKTVSASCPSITIEKVGN